MKTMFFIFGLVLTINCNAKAKSAQIQYLCTGTSGYYTGTTKSLRIDQDRQTLYFTGADSFPLTLRQDGRYEGSSHDSDTFEYTAQLTEQPKATLDLSVHEYFRNGFNGASGVWDNTFSCRHGSPPPYMLGHCFYNAENSQSVQLQRIALKNEERYCKNGCEIKGNYECAIVSPPLGWGNN